MAAADDTDGDRFSHIRKSVTENTQSGSRPDGVSVSVELENASGQLHKYRRTFEESHSDIAMVSENEEVASG